MVEETAIMPSPAEIADEQLRWWRQNGWSPLRCLNAMEIIYHDAPDIGIGVTWRVVKVAMLKKIAKMEKSKQRMNVVKRVGWRNRVPPSVNDELIRLYNDGFTRTQICERLDISLGMYDTRTRMLRNRGLIKWHEEAVKPVIEKAPAGPRYKPPADACDDLLTRLIQVYGPQRSTLSK